MVRLPIVSSDEVISVLRKNGFDFAPKRGKGSHSAFYKTDEQGIKRLVIIPKRKEIPRGTLISILHQANKTKDEFISLL